MSLLQQLFRAQRRPEHTCWWAVCLLLLESSHTSELTVPLCAPMRTAGSFALHAEPEPSCGLSCMCTAGAGAVFWERTRGQLLWDKQRHSSLSWISSLVNQSHWWWITPLQLQEFPLLQVNGRTEVILGLSGIVHIQGCCRNHIGTIWEPQLYSGLCVCPARKAGQPEKRGLLSLDGMGDRPTPEGLDHLKGPWHISYREPCEVGWKEAHNWCSANFLFTKKKKNALHFPTLWFPPGPFDQDPSSPD